MNSFRSFMTSKVGAAIAIGFLILIAFAFASGDVSNVKSFGGVAGGDSVATVGKERIDTSTLSQTATSALDRVKQEDPTMSMKAFIANDGLDGVLNDLINRLAIAGFGREHGIIASDRLIDSEISKIQAFKGADGKFNETLFRQALQQQGISDALLRDDIAQGLIARQIMVPASVGAQMPRKLAVRYAALLGETRIGEIAILPSLLFRSEKEPTDKEIADYYAKNKSDFIRPERRKIRYAVFDVSSLAKAPAPTEAEIAARYKANAAQYAASEKRSILQLIVPTEAAAKAVAAEVASGKSLEASAKAKGLEASKLEPLSKQEMTSQYSAALANAVFATARGQLAAPARSDLGWHVARVESIDERPARTLDQVRGELTTAVAAEKDRAAITDALEKIENELDDGGSLVEVAERLGAKVVTTDPLTANGGVYLKPGAQAPKELQPALQTAFAMETEEPQLAEVERGKTFMIYDVTEIAESAAAPLKEIRDDVKAALIVSKSSVKARESAKQVQAEMAKGKTMAQALSALGRRLPPVQNVRMTRPELARLQQQHRQVPPPIALMFNMAKGTVKVQPAPNKQAWFVVSLKTIEPGKVEEGDKVIEASRGQLGAMLGNEYSDALGRAIRNEVGVERNPAAIKAVRDKLAGES
ncbi:MAG: SurA N-terminal domain-containing protein [Novosphingobium sp.]|nr:SurA N-terminal domain-containing protein [Novosphingobium sp.]